MRRKERGPARLACFPGHRWKGARLPGRASPRVLCPDSGRGGPEPGEEPAVTRETEEAASHHARPEPQCPQNVGAAGGPGHRAPSSLLASGEAGGLGQSWRRGRTTCCRRPPSGGRRVPPRYACFPCTVGCSPRRAGSGPKRGVCVAVHWSVAVVVSVCARGSVRVSVPASSQRQAVSHLPGPLRPADLCTAVGSGLATPQPHSFWAAASKPLQAQPRGSQFHRSDVAPWSQNSPIRNLPKLISCAFPKRAASFPKTPRGRISTPLVAGQDQVPKEQSGQPEDHGEKPRARAQGSGCLSPPPAALPPARLSAMCAQLRQGRLGSLSRHVAGAGPALQVAQSLSPVPSATTSRAGSGAGCHPGGGRQGARTGVGAPPIPLPES